MSKKEQILEAAEALFAEHGYEGTSVRALAREAKVNIAMISYYFGSKEKLFEALIKFRTSYLREKFQGLNKDIHDPIKRLEMFVEIYVDRIFAQPKFLRIIYRQISLKNRSEINEVLVNILMKNVEEVRKMIRDGVKKKVFRNSDVDLLITSLFGTTFQIAHSSLLTSKLLGWPLGKFSMNNEKLKTRLKSYLKDLIKRYLLIQTDKKNY